VPVARLRTLFCDGAGHFGAQIERRARDAHHAVARLDPPAAGGERPEVGTALEAVHHFDRHDVGRGILHRHQPREIHEQLEPESLRGGERRRRRGQADHAPGSMADPERTASDWWATASSVVIRSGVAMRATLAARFSATTNRARACAPASRAGP
jgi:hypothetical protein